MTDIATQGEVTNPLHALLNTLAFDTERPVSKHVDTTTQTGFIAILDNLTM